MAKLTGALQMTGSIGGLSIYRMKGCDELVVRTKGGFTKERINNDDKLLNVRSLNREWSGVASLAGSIRRALVRLGESSDFNFTGQLCAIAKQIQKSDVNGRYGERALLLSHHRHTLVGFSLNRTTPFPTVIKPPVKGEIDRESGSAKLSFAAMESEHSMVLPYEVSHYRLVGVLSTVSDVVFDVDAKSYQPIDKNGTTAYVESEWYPGEASFGGLTLELNFRQNGESIHPQCSLLLGVGIEFGRIDALGQPKASGSGAAMILEVG